MTQLIADRTPMELLIHVEEPVEICDALGKVIGRFTPADSERVRARYARVPGAAELVEIERRKAPGRKGYSTCEILEKLKSLTEDVETQEYLQQIIEDMKERDRCDAR